RRKGPCPISRDRREPLRGKSSHFQPRHASNSPAELPLRLSSALAPRRQLSAGLRPALKRRREASNVLRGRASPRQRSALRTGGRVPLSSAEAAAPRPTNPSRNRG